MLKLPFEAEVPENEAQTIEAPETGCPVYMSTTWPERGALVGDEAGGEQLAISNARKTEIIMTGQSFDHFMGFS
jgi:hypothetical protein